MNYFFKRAEERVDRFGSAAASATVGAFLRERFGASLSTGSSSLVARFAGF